MTKLYVIGNGQMEGLMRSLQFFQPSLIVEGCPLWKLDETFRDEAHCLSHLQEYGHVFTMPFDTAFTSVIDSATIQRDIPHTTLYPAVTFDAYHPDLSYIVSRQQPGMTLPSPLGPYQSALAFYGYLRGYDVARTLGLYRDDVFEALGYYAAWPKAEAELRQLPLAREYQLADRLRTWAQHGCFMHTPKHPKLVVLADMARAMMKHAGYTVGNADPLAFLPDDLMRDHVWPVYPEIGRFFGIPGEYVFKRDGSPSPWPDYLSLEEFVAASYACFAEHDLATYHCARVDAWLAAGVAL